MPAPARGATFGALSEKELQLALSTGLDLSLQGEELNKHILEKIAAQTKMRDWLISQSKILTKGDVTYSSYIQKYNAEKPRANPIVNYASPQNAGSGATGTGGLVLSKKQIDPSVQVFGVVYFLTIHVYSENGRNHF